MKSAVHQYVYNSLKNAFTQQSLNLPGDVPGVMQVVQAIRDYSTDVMVDRLTQESQTNDECPFETENIAMRIRNVHRCAYTRSFHLWRDRGRPMDDEVMMRQVQESVVNNPKFYGLCLILQNILESDMSIEEQVTGILGAMATASEALMALANKMGQVERE